MVGKRLFDLFDYRVARRQDRPRLLVDPEPAAPHRAPARGGPAGRLAAARAGAAAGRAARASTGRPTRPDVIGTLDARRAAARQSRSCSRGPAATPRSSNACARRCGSPPTTERGRIAEVIDRRTADLGPKPIWSCSTITSGEKGCCAVWPPIMPGCCRSSATPSRSCSPPGLVKAVFATETLALGINMPARTVVLERLVKYNGEQHAPLTPGEYTRLTGRAGRRGIDVEGHAVVLWHPDVNLRPRRGRGPGLDPHLPAAQFVRAVLQHDDQPGEPDGPDAGAQAAGTLVRAVPGRPFGGRAWCAASRAASGCSTRSAAEPRRANTRRSWITCGCALKISDRERAQSRASRLQRRKAANDALAALRRGDIITITHGRRSGLAVVLEPERDGDDPRPLVLTEHRWADRISSADYWGASAGLGLDATAQAVEHRQPRGAARLASALRLGGGRTGRPVRCQRDKAPKTRCRPRTGRAA